MTTAVVQQRKRKVFLEGTPQDTIISERQQSPALLQNLIADSKFVTERDVQNELLKLEHKDRDLEKLKVLTTLD